MLVNQIDSVTMRERFPVVESSPSVWGGPVAMPEQGQGLCCTTPV
ncbi:MAG: hypothetical protein QOF73_982 [Thermomicrobiales bacterium]|nr:hypothetical protein [Thermomicrobiales bacterium]